jgi:hypothetical protein
MAGFKYYVWIFVLLLVPFVFGIDCIDLDGDSFYSNLFGCGEVDCNDEFNYYHPETGEYCSIEDYFVLDPAEGYLAQDFAIIEDNNGDLHIIYIRFPWGTSWQANPTNSMDFGHESSSDLITWDNHDPALTISETGNWDDEHVWAPSIVYNPVDELYYMHYAGVTDGFTQSAANHKERIGLATSSDLITWDKYPGNNCAGTTGEGCLMDCDFPWNAWGEIEDSWTYQCRDPNIFFDSVSGNWYMVYSTSPSPFDWKMIVGLAKSSDLINWEDLGPINNTLYGKAESAHIVEKEGLYYLFFTSGIPSSSIDGIFYIYTNDLESNIWSSRIQVPDSNFNSIASEFLELNNQSLFAYIYPFGNVRFRSIDFEEGEVSLGLLFPLDCSYIDSSLVFPGAEEILNGLDDNCNGLIDEDNPICVDLDGDGFGAVFNVDCLNQGIDCDDNNFLINPSALESCGNFVDDNCNGRINEGCKRFNYYNIQMDFLSRY